MDERWASGGSSNMSGDGREESRENKGKKKNKRRRYCAVVRSGERVGRERQGEGELGKRFVGEEECTHSRIGSCRHARVFARTQGGAGGLAWGGWT